MHATSINVYDYMDYREFLRDCYRTQRGLNPRFSYRYIAQKVGFRSASFFSQLLKGRCNMSVSMAARFAEFLCLKRKDAEYFEALVQYNQARKPEDKERWLQRVASIRACKIRILEADQREFYEKWHYAAVRELLSFFPWDGDYAVLASLLTPAVEPEEAKQAVDLLLRLNMIRETPQGRLVRSDSVSYSTGYETPNEAIRRFQLQTLALAGEALERFDSRESRLSTLTLSLSPKGFSALEDEMKSFRHRLMRIAEKDMGENAVYQVNLQAFPLARASGSSAQEAGSRREENKNRGFGRFRQEGHRLQREPAETGVH